ncbi:MAG: ATP-binding cassette domain-containing protein [Chloroflexota bacterium]
MIQVEGVSYRYAHTDATALQSVSLEIKAGEVAGIVGPNGSGKSTLGRLIKGLLLPDDGRVLVDGLDTRTHTLDVRRLVGLVFQNPNNQMVNATVEHEVAFGPENLGLPPGEIRFRVARALAQVGLESRRSNECHSLSLANKQRVALAAVIAMEPRYLVLDEPTAWVEPRDRWPLLRSVVQWAAGRNVGLVLVTHRMEEAELCGTLYGMLSGHMAASGTVDEVLGDAQVRRRLALEIPETFALVRELRAAGVNVQPGPGGIEAIAEALCHS